MVQHQVKEGHSKENATKNIKKQNPIKIISSAIKRFFNYIIIKHKLFVCKIAKLQ